MDMITKSIWGDKTARESEEEPVSGERGAGTASDPYDKGNEEAQREEDAKDANDAAAAVATSSVSQPQRDGPSDSVDHTGDPNSGAQPTQKQQGADRPAEAPESVSAAGSSGSNAASTGGNSTASGKSGGKPDMPHTDEEREELMLKGEFPRDPDDHSGEPLQMHGAPSDADKPSSEGDAVKTGRSASVAQEGGGPHGKTLGTGEKYVKTTGVAADGGDFDATKPGAGQEATRLMEEAGLKTEAQAPPSQQKDEKASKDDAADKPGKLTKLKEKLHIGKAH